MTAISEDTPEGGPEELQWKIDRLIEQVERDKAELERTRQNYNDMMERRNKAMDRFYELTSRLTVGVLRKAGYIVEIKDVAFCDTCGEEY